MRVRRMAAQCICAFFICGLLCGLCGYAAEEEGAGNAGCGVLLNALGIVQAETDADSADPVTRGQFAAWAAALVNQRETAKGCTQQQFADVLPGYPFFAEVNYLKLQGYVSGVNGVSFEPDRAISAGEGISVLMHMLGYGDILKAEGSDYDCMKMADSVGLLSARGEFDPESALCTADAVRLLYRALTEADYLKFRRIAYGDKTTESGYAPSTILKEIFRISEGAGIVDANMYTALTSTQGTGAANKITIDGKGYSVGDLKYMTYLGYHVRYFASEEDEIIAMWTERNNTLTLSDDVLLGYENLRYTYAREEDSRPRTAVLDPGYDLIYNNKCSAEGFNEAKYIPATGTVTLIDNNNDKSYDVVLTRDYVYRIVKEVREDIATFRVPDAGKRFPVLDFADEKREFVFVDEDGGVSTEMNLNPEYICSIVESEPDALGNTFCEVYVSNRRQDRIVNAEVKEIRYDENQEIEYVLLDNGTETARHRVAKQENRHGLFSIRCGDKAVFYIAPDGSLIAEDAPRDQKLIGLLLETAYEEWGDSIKVLLLQTDGTIAERDCREPLRVSAPADNNSTDRKIYGRKDLGQAYEKLIAPGREVPILYTLDEDGKIASIEMPVLAGYADMNRSQGLHSLTNGSFRKMQYIKNSQAFTDVSAVKNESGIAALSYTPVVFFVPPSGSDVSGVERSRRYRVGSVDNFGSDAAPVDIYAIDDCSAVGDIVVQERSLDHTVNTSTAMCAVESVNAVYEEDEVKTRIEAWINGEKKLIYATDDSILTELKSGDVIQAETVGDTLEDYRRILSYDAEAGRPYLDAQSFDTNEERTMWRIRDNVYAVSNSVAYNTNSKYVFGAAYKKENGSIIVADMDEAVSGSLTSAEVTSLRKHNQNLVYDPRTETWKKAVGEDVYDYRSVGENASYVFSWSNWLAFYNLFIYN